MKDETTAPGSRLAKERAAKRLAQAHFLVEPGITRIFRLECDTEQRPEEPIKLLEVNANTIAAGIVPVQFGPDAETGISFRSIIVEIAPDEYATLAVGRLRLPNGWRLGHEFRRPARASKR
jgi:hypothetical protein